MDFLTCLSCVERHKNKVSEENRNLKEQIFELQQENHLLVTKHIEYNQKKDLQIARLQDKLEFASEQADTFAKALVKVYDLIDDLQKRYDEYDDMIYPELEKILNSIPESALRRAE